MTAYYNEFDPYAAQWLRNLIAAGELPAGEVDERSIAEVSADDLAGFDQCHFFAGIGGWPVALRLAGWPDDRPVWTGSCPCQPFSGAGAGKAGDDERHLWPTWFPLIAQRRPPVVFGEQVEAAIGWGWLDLVFANLEGEGYACGATVLPACGVGAAHIRQRLWFVANSVRSGAEHTPGQGMAAQATPDRSDGCLSRERLRPGVESTTRGMADADGRDAGAEGLQRSRQHGQRSQDGSLGELGDAAGGGQRKLGDALGSRRSGHPDGASFALDVGDAGAPGLSARERQALLGAGRRIEGRATQQSSGPLAGFWADAEWIACTDGKARPVGPGSFPLAHGVQRRTSKLRAYGNAIVPQVAAEFVSAYMEAAQPSHPLTPRMVKMSE